MVNVEGRKSSALSILLYAPARRAHKGAQAPPLCEYRLPVECKRNMMNYAIAHLNLVSRAGLRKP